MLSGEARKITGNSSIVTYFKMGSLNKLTAHMRPVKLQPDESIYRPSSESNTRLFRRRDFWHLVHSPNNLESHIRSPRARADGGRIMKRTRVLIKTKDTTANSTVTASYLETGIQQVFKGVYPRLGLFGTDEGHDMSPRAEPYPEMEIGIELREKLGSFVQRRSCNTKLS